VTQAVRMQPSFGARIIGRLVRDVKSVFGVESYLLNEDRHVLEQVIFPYFLCRKQYQNVLFVGCHWYTKGYNRYFVERKNYWTIDIDPRKIKYGARQHVVDGMQNLTRHFHAGTLDLILCNGVFGWGLMRAKTSRMGSRHPSIASARTEPWSSAGMTLMSVARFLSRSASVCAVSRPCTSRRWPRRGT